MDVADPERDAPRGGPVLQPGGSSSSPSGIRSCWRPSASGVHDAPGARQALMIGGYFCQGPLTGTWIFNTVPTGARDRHRPFTITYARRTLAGWLTAVLAAGLTIEAVAEPHADEQTAAACPQVADSRVAPAPHCRRVCFIAPPGTGTTPAARCSGPGRCSMTRGGPRQGSNRELGGSNG
jgi:hypothetical protein